MIKPMMRAAVLLAASAGTFLHAQTFETLHQFSGTDGEAPRQAMTLGDDGALYGVTSKGGASGDGVVFRYSYGNPSGFSVVKHLDRATTGGSRADSFLVEARLLNIGDGYLYGATYWGGKPSNLGGTVYRFDMDGNFNVIYEIPDTLGLPSGFVYLASGEQNVLHVLCDDTSGLRRLPLDGITAPTIPWTASGTPNPRAIIRASNGYLYGGTRTGGNGGAGYLFRTNGDGTNFTILHHCTTATGTIPIGAMVQGRDGNLYGLMAYSGTGFSANGVLYRLSLDGEYTVLRNFTDFDELFGDLCLASDGMLYGTAVAVGPGGNGNGGIWRIKTDGTGYKVLQVFKTGSDPLYPDGRKPIGGLVQGTDGNLYGTTYGGVGSGGDGTIFRLNLKLPPPPVNRPPIALDDTVLSTGVPVTVSVLDNDFDPDSDPVYLQVQTAPTAGTAVVQNGAIVYTPNGGFAAVDSFTYRISDGRGGVSEATVFVKTALTQGEVIGNYEGLLKLDDDLDGTDENSRARWTLSVAAAGKFTGKLYTQGKTIPFKGVLDAANTVAITVKLPSVGTGDFFIAIQSGSPRSAKGYFFGTENWSGSAYRAVSATTAKAYTVQLTNAVGSPDQMPDGNGYGTLKVSKVGKVSAVGKLGDGSVLKWSSSLVTLPNGTTAIPVHQDPIKGTTFGGLLNASGDPGEDFIGTAHWNRPAIPNAATSPKPYALGFEGDVSVVVGLYTPPAPKTLVMNLSGLVVAARGGTLTSTSFGVFTVNGTRITPEPNSKLKSLSFTASNGMFSGSIVADGKTRAFKGVVNQGYRFGAGQISISGVTSGATIEND